MVGGTPTLVSSQLARSPKIEVSRHDKLFGTSPTISCEDADIASPEIARRAIERITRLVVFVLPRASYRGPSKDA